MPSPLLLQSLVMFVAAFLAGTMNAVAGGGILVTFSVLVALGIDAKVANASSTLALWPGLLGGFFAYRHELQHHRGFVALLSVPCLTGGAIGAGLLVATPSETFARLVPFLILFATFLFALQDPVRRFFSLHDVSTDPTVQWWMVAIVFQFLSSIYGGYFGAGNGILILAALSLLGISNIHRANGVKAILCLCLNGAAVVWFVLESLINWKAASVMAVGALLGGYCSANAATRFGEAFSRTAIVVIGIVISFVMLVKFWFR